MRTISISYILFVTAAICGLYTLSNLIYRYLNLTDTVEFCAIIAHGASIVLFIHLIGKIAGISICWRIAVDAIIPTLGFAVWYILLRDSSGDRFTFPAILVAGVYLIKFSISALVVEFAMRSLEKQWKLLKPTVVAG